MSLGRVGTFWQCYQGEKQGLGVGRELLRMGGEGNRWEEGAEEGGKLHPPLPLLPAAERLTEEA